MAMTDIEKREGRTSPTLQEEPRRRVVSPPVDIFENEHELLLYADMPGVAEDGLDLRVDSEQITIEGRWSAPEEGSLVACGFRGMDYARSFTLPAGVDLENVSAELRHGVLTVKMPKAAQYRPRQIKVTSG